MTAAVAPILQFVKYAGTLKGDEKGEAQPTLSQGLAFLSKSVTS